MGEIMSLKNQPKTRLVSPKTLIAMKRETKRNEMRNETVSCSAIPFFPRRSIQKSEMRFLTGGETNHPKKGPFRFRSFPCREAALLPVNGETMAESVSPCQRQRQSKKRYLEKAKKAPQCPAQRLTSKKFFLGR
jgi:hypothetical protein